MPASKMETHTRNNRGVLVLRPVCCTRMAPSNLCSWSVGDAGQDNFDFFVCFLVVLTHLSSGSNRLSRVFRLLPDFPSFSIAYFVELIHPGRNRQSSQCLCIRIYIYIYIESCSRSDHCFYVLLYWYVGSPPSFVIAFVMCYVQKKGSNPG